MDKRRSQNYDQSENDDSEVDLTLRLGVPTGEDNLEEDTQVPVLRDFMGVGGGNLDNNNQGNFAMQSGQASFDLGGSSACVVNGPYRPLAMCAPHGSGSGSGSMLSEEGLLPTTGFATPSRKRPSMDDGKYCRFCGSKSSPLWRKGPGGPQTLCNACGLKHARQTKKGSNQEHR